MILEDILASFQNNTCDGTTLQYADTEEKYRYFTFDRDEEYGVLLEISEESEDINESFSEVAFYTERFSFSPNNLHKVLILSCTQKKFLHKFAGICIRNSDLCGNWF